ncbi:ABC-2 type transport system ATP-binding protein [Algoriphagus ratkowskyi]|uniref:ABC transporter ATP-binding protein n=1 Tax=Algoriphagus ratkowskyi TaxID=57028 RepID=A0A2W7QUD3_9BACT|nr:ATP-binding cassette domain-containing protein [Algoriphagus ratkowskyi]PZX52133.1 ABC-2 type transport system ATP-binding protein [Algoriphagus ratkowskyi]TXD76105.1 ABC transporter ATP-binding protein [Algoriphagus ratkowskyi]
MLEIQHFRKTYLTGFQLEFNSLHLSKGIHLIKGENGSGKSTLLKAIAGIHGFEGDVVLNGLSLKKEPIAFRKLVNYSEAEPLFPEFLTMDELIAFVAKTKKADISQINSLKEILGIGDFSQNSISTYSSGMLKKTGLILAFLGNPSLIILDEPYTTIDVGSQKRLTELVNRELKNGVNFLLTSHIADFEEFFTYDSILNIADGTLVHCHE